MSNKHWNVQIYDWQCRFLMLWVFGVGGRWKVQEENVRVGFLGDAGGTVRMEFTSHPYGCLWLYRIVSSSLYWLCLWSTLDCLWLVMTVLYVKQKFWLYIANMLKKCRHLVYKYYYSEYEFFVKFYRSWITFEKSVWWSDCSCYSKCKGEVTVTNAKD